MASSAHPFLVEVDRQEETGLVLEYGIDTRDEGLPDVVLPGQVPEDDLVGDSQEPAVRALGAFDPGLLANPPNPLVRAGRCVAGLARLPAFEAARIDVVATAEQRTEQTDLRLGRRPLVHAIRFCIHSYYSLREGNHMLASHSSGSLIDVRGVNPKLIADQQGHGVDVNLNVYTQSSVASRREALDTLESVFLN